MIYILIFDGGLQALSITKSLHTAGQFVGIATSKTDVAYYCRYVDRKHHIVARMEFDKQVYGILQEHKYDVIIPMSDRAAEFLSLNKSHIEATYSSKCAVPNYETFIVGYDKKRLMQFCEEHNISHPKTHSISSEDIKTAVKHVGFPALIKPDFSVGARGIIRVDCIDDISNVLKNIESKYGSCCLQQYIKNDNEYFNVVLYRTANGNCDKNAIVKIIRKYPLKAGSSSFCISVKNDRLLSICSELLDKLNWHGIADLDVLWDSDSDQYYIIEINPRVPASIRCSIEAGVDFADAIVKDLIGKTMNTHSYKEGVQLRYLGLDVMWFIKSPNRFCCTPSWFKFRGSDLYYQDYYKENPATFILGVLFKLSKIFHR